MRFDWSFALDILPVLAKAAIVTVQATLIGYALALSVGLVLALMRRSPAKWLSWPAAGFIEFVRSTPLLVQLYFMYFVLPDFGIAMSALTTGILGLGLHYAAYTAEVYRAGLESIPKGQWEAAAAGGLSKFRTYQKIIVPQAIPPVAPALGNYFVAMFKETPLLSAIAVVELMQRAKIVGSETFRYLEPITLVGFFFLALSLLAAWTVRRAENYLSLTRRMKQAAENANAGTPPSQA